MSHVLLYEGGPGSGAGVRLLLAGDGYDLTTCADGACLIESLMEHRPDAVVHVLRPDCPQDLAVLQLLRRAAPMLPIVVLAQQTSLDLRRIVQDLRPTYYAVAPVDVVEMRAAMGAALGRRSAAAG